MANQGSNQEQLNQQIQSALGQPWQTPVNATTGGQQTGNETQAPGQQRGPIEMPAEPPPAYAGPPPSGSVPQRGTPLVDVNRAQAFLQRANRAQAQLRSPASGRPGNLAQALREDAARAQAIAAAQLRGEIPGGPPSAGLPLSGALPPGGLRSGGLPAPLVFQQRNDDAGSSSDDETSNRNNTLRVNVNAQISVQGTGSIVAMEPVNTMTLTTDVIRALNQQGVFTQQQQPQGGNADPNTRTTTRPRRNIQINITGGVSVIGNRHIVGPDITMAMHAAAAQRDRGMGPTPTSSAPGSRNVSGAQGPTASPAASAALGSSGTQGPTGPSATSSAPGSRNVSDDYTGPTGPSTVYPTSR